MKHLSLNRHIHTSYQTFSWICVEPQSVSSHIASHSLPAFHFTVHLTFRFTWSLFVAVRWRGGPWRETCVAQGTVKQSVRNVMAVSRTLATLMRIAWDATRLSTQQLARKELQKLNCFETRFFYSTRFLKNLSRMLRGVKEISESSKPFQNQPLLYF